MRKIISERFFKVFIHNKAGNVLVRKRDSCECDYFTRSIVVTIDYEGVESNLIIPYGDEEERDREFEKMDDYESKIDSLIEMLEKNKN